MKDIEKLYLHIFNSPEGNQVLEHLEKVFQEKVGMFDHNQYAYYSGERNVIHHINKMIEKGKKE